MWSLQVVIALALLAPSAAFFSARTQAGVVSNVHFGGKWRLQASKADEMEYTTLGDSDLRVSKVCLGTMTWGEQNTEEEGIAQMDCAFDEYGVNFLDTAEMYPVPTNAETQGYTDRTIAAWLKQRPASFRDDVVLATKVAGASERITWLREDGRGTRVAKADILESVDKSLERLGTDYVDLLQIHWPDRYVPLFGEAGYDPAKEREAIAFEEQLDALRSLVEAGKVRHIGLSNETPYGVMKFTELAEREGYPKVISLQNSYSLLVRSDYESGGLAEVCSPRNCNVGLLAYSPLAGGILTHKYAAPSPGAVTKASGGGALKAKPRLDLFPGFMDRYKKSLAVEAVDEYAKVAKAHLLTPTQLSLMWCYSRPWVASTIIGATSLPQLKENLDAWGQHNALPDSALEAIEEVFAKYRDPAKA